MSMMPPPEGVQYVRYPSHERDSAESGYRAVSAPIESETGRDGCGREEMSGEVFYKHRGQCRDGLARCGSLGPGTITNAMKRPLEMQVQSL
jgi:hypothetical protein